MQYILAMHTYLCVHTVPWSAAKEAAEEELCSKYFLGNIDTVVHESGMGWSELMEVSIKRVCSRGIEWLDQSPGIYSNGTWSREDYSKLSSKAALSGAPLLWHAQGVMVQQGMLFRSMCLYRYGSISRA